MNSLTGQFPKMVPSCFEAIRLSPQLGVACRIDGLGLRFSGLHKP